MSRSTSWQCRTWHSRLERLVRGEDIDRHRPLEDDCLIVQELLGGAFLRMDQGDPEGALPGTAAQNKEWREVVSAA